MAASYRCAIAWIVNNEDLDWLCTYEKHRPSQCAALVADLFDKTDDKVAADVRAAIKKAAL